MMKINRHTLANGLRVVHVYADHTRMTAMNLLYGVGAKNEDEDKTGLAHLLEHLMFSGSRNVKDFSEYVQRAAGECNAWTNNDVTNYYLNIPSSNIETAFWLESDRMAFLNLDDRSVKTQKDVVCEEFKQRVYNVPYGDVGHILRSLCYRQHPYKWPTIGKDLAFIENMTCQDVADFYCSHYVPSNAVLAVVGNVPFDEVVRLSEKWFGTICSDRRHVTKHCQAEGKQSEARHIEVQRNVPVDMIFMAFHMCGRCDHDFYGYDMISDILSNGKSSRIINNLVKRDKIFSSINAYIDGSIEPGLLHVNGKINPGISFEVAESKILEEIRCLTSNEITEKELDKVKNKFESNCLFSNLNNLNLAYNLAYNELLGDADKINHEVEQYRAVTIDEINSIIDNHLVPQNSSVVYYKSNR